MEEQFTRFFNAILDTGADEPRTEFQRGLLKTAQILMNILTALTFALLSLSLAIAVLRLITEALNIDPTGFGGLVFFVGVAAGLIGGRQAMHITQAIRRYQVFTFIGIANVLTSVLINMGPVLRASVDGSVSDIINAVAQLLRGFFVGG